MAEPSGGITKAQLLGLARQLKTAQSTEQEAGALEHLAETGLSEGQQTQLRGLMQDKAKLAQVLGSPQAQALMRKLNGGKKE
jgi:hypothetical protein